jgi:hypothetical protein
MNQREIMVGANGFEPSTSWSRISTRNTILLARLALFCVKHADMDPYSAAIGLKSDSTIWAQMSPRDFAEKASQSGKREIRLVL